MVPEELLSFTPATTATCGEGGLKYGERGIKKKREERATREGQVMRGQSPSTVGLPEPERHANFMVNWATHLGS